MCAHTSVRSPPLHPRIAPALPSKGLRSGPQTFPNLPESSYEDSDFPAPLILLSVHTTYLRYSPLVLVSAGGTPIQFQHWRVISGSWTKPVLDPDLMKLLKWQWRVEVTLPGGLQL